MSGKFGSPVESLVSSAEWEASPRGRATDPRRTLPIDPLELDRRIASIADLHRLNSRTSLGARLPRPPGASEGIVSQSPPLRQTPQPILGSAARHRRMLVPIVGWQLDLRPPHCASRALAGTRGCGRLPHTRGRFSALFPNEFKECDGNSDSVSPGSNPGSPANLSAGNNKEKAPAHRGRHLQNGPGVCSCVLGPFWRV